MARAMLVCLCSAATDALSAAPRGFGSTSSATKGVVSSLTRLVNLQGGAKPERAPRPRAKEALSVDEVRRGLEVDFSNEYLWSGEITAELRGGRVGDKHASGPDLARSVEGRRQVDDAAKIVARGRRAAAFDTEA